MYAYLAWSLLLGFIWLVLYTHRRDLRFEMLFSSLLFLPFGLTQPLYVPDYWNPVVLYKLWGLFDAESLLWTFFTGGIAAVLYEEIFSRRLKKMPYGNKARHHAYVIYAYMVLLVVALFLIHHFTGWSVLRTSFVLVSPGVAYFLVTRRDVLRESLIGGSLFALLYIASLLFINLLFPDFIAEQWNAHGLLGIYLFSVPAEEYVYAFLFGMVWSVIYEEIKNIKLNKA